MRILVPGLPQIRRGRWVEGGGALTLWVGLWVLAISRFDRIQAVFSGEGGDWIAFFSLVLLLVGVWAWSRREDQRARSIPEEALDGSSSDAWSWWTAFKGNRAALFGLSIVVALVLAALLAPFLAPFDPLDLPGFQSPGDLGLRFVPPSWTTYLGRDQLSRDVLSRILFGARLSLSVGALAVGISISLGAVLGAVSGYLGGWVDTAIMRLVDVFMAFPRIVLAIVFVAVFEPSVFLVVVVLALTQWPIAARLVRGEILSLKEREFSEAAKALGFSRARILFRHLLPNAMAPIIIAATLGFGNVILLEAGLSFLGLGVPESLPSWGAMVSDGLDHLFSAWWISTFPGLVLTFSVLALNLVGDGLRDVFDPRQEGRFRP